MELNKVWKLINHAHACQSAASIACDRNDSKAVNVHCQDFARFENELKTMFAHMTKEQIVQALLHRFIPLDR